MARARRWQAACPQGRQFRDPLQTKPDAPTTHRRRAVLVRCRAHCRQSCSVGDLADRGAVPVMSSHRRPRCKVRHSGRHHGDRVLRLWSGTSIHFLGAPILPALTRARRIRSVTGCRSSSTARTATPSITSSAPTWSTRRTGAPRHCEQVAGEDPGARECGQLKSPASRTSHRSRRGPAGTRAPRSTYPPCRPSAASR